ncbi:MAG: PEP-CTERM sorting domain-containing protein [Phenylobacterium sp.]|mgnify:CR=1 FL=1|uniref:PEPxxWA-CTERM sorting domain-containing protein n=1 Tax=Phenylobacterium sp. SCN 70-31 TaxID=1660129 RepID=UPI000868C50D|nr:PEPxxWA-CTERM sorting domain-containing protein [Phenylobacterium sp. SCN 70-31]MCW5759751.1 PEP-CTERM sorting domain-containing protein [Phenylobacterium sp.]ODT88447.1 MAG: hypothetical protein ABS78_07495 [Phenylobacterium sp. SCN 70-31]
MTRKFVAALAATAGLAFAATQAQATVFAGNWELTAYNSADPGLVLKINGPLTDTFDLDLGSDPVQSFDLFKLYTNETNVNGDDTAWSAISLKFTFDSPSNNNGPIFVNGDTNGYTFFGIYQAGQLVWDQGGQALLTWGHGEPGLEDPGRMTITVNGGTFNEGLFGLNEGKKHGLKVAAEFHWDNNPTFGAVPEPATWALMIGGFGMAGATLRRRRSLAYA